jgi:4a-hydroxytetrahydrobiopterin dehydratase
MAEKLSDDEVAAGIESSQWGRVEDTIVRDHQFKDFAEAMAFANRVADAAEEANHHPDILVHGWNKVRLTLSTHSVGGLTQGDLDMARRLDEI